MTIQQAEQWIRDYQKVLSDDTKRGSRRHPRLLPAPKEKLLHAINLQLAHRDGIRPAGRFGHLPQRPRDAPGDENTHDQQDDRSSQPAEGDHGLKLMANAMRLARAACQKA